MDRKIILVLGGLILVHPAAAQMMGYYGYNQTAYPYGMMGYGGNNESYYPYGMMGYGGYGGMPMMGGYGMMGPQMMSGYQGLGGYGMMGGYNPYGGLGSVGWVLVLILAGIVFYFLVSARGRSRNAIDILKERYAKGEIGEDEFNKMKKNLEG